MEKWSDFTPPIYNVWKQQSKSDTAITHDAGGLGLDRELEVHGSHQFDQCGALPHPIAHSARGFDSV